jgi:hypothetical protein
MGAYAIQQRNHSNSLAEKRLKHAKKQLKKARHHDKKKQKEVAT